MDDSEYLRRIEMLAQTVVEQAAVEGWLTFELSEPISTPLQKSINDLARNLRMQHHEGDGCVDH